MNSFYQDVQLNNVDMLNKELVSLYAHSMRVVNNLTIIKMSHTKYQTNRYFQTNHYSRSLSQLLNTSKNLVKFREMLFFTLRQVYLKQHQLLTVVQWMSPPFEMSTKRAADQHILKQIMYKRHMLPPLIYIIEIDRLLRVLQFDHREITLKILFELCTAMGCLIRADKEYILYDRFFYILHSHFKPDEPEAATNQRELERRIKSELLNQQNTQGLRKVGVINDYTALIDPKNPGYQEIDDLDGEIYDSIANLLLAKGNDFMHYTFMGFRIQLQPIKLNVTYCNPNTKCKLLLRTLSLAVQPPQKKRPLTASRPLSGLGIKFKPESVLQPSSNVKTFGRKENTWTHVISYLLDKQIINRLGFPMIIQGEEIESNHGLQPHMVVYQEETDVESLKGQPIPAQYLNPYQQKDFLRISKGAIIFGIAKPTLNLEFHSDSESEEEEFSTIDQPIYVELNEKQHQENKIKEKGWKGLHGRPSSKRLLQKVPEQDGIAIVEQAQEEDKEAEQLIGNLNIPYRKRTIEFEFEEYEAEVGHETKEEAVVQDSYVELDLRQFGFGESMRYQVYSSTFVRAIRISFPDSNMELPVMHFPTLDERDTYDLHTWVISPIDNIKGIQLQRKQIQGIDFVSNFVFLVQDDSKHPVNCSFDFKQQQPIEHLPSMVMPPVDGKWRHGQFRIQLNFDLSTLKGNREIEAVVLLLKKLNTIFQQMFPGLIIDENSKRIRYVTRHNERQKCVFEVYLQGMGRPKLRDNYDRYYLVSVENWAKFTQSFDKVVTDLIDNLTLLVWSYGGIAQIQQMEQEISKRSAGTITKSYAYKFVQT